MNKTRNPENKPEFQTPDPLIVPVFFILPDNLEGLTGVVEALEDFGPQAYDSLVMVDDQVREEGTRLAERIDALYSHVALQPVTSGQMVAPKKHSAMMSVFVSRWLSRLSGVKVIIDGPHAPKKDNWLKLLLAEYMREPAPFVGRFREPARGGLEPIGPLMLAATLGQCRQLMYYDQTHWRLANHWGFAKMGRKAMPANWPFKLSVSKTEPGKDPTPSPA